MSAAEQRTELIKIQQQASFQMAGIAIEQQWFKCENQFTNATTISKTSSVHPAPY